MVHRMLGSRDTNIEITVYVISMRQIKKNPGKFAKII